MPDLRPGDNLIQVSGGFSGLQRRVLARKDRRTKKKKGKSNHV
jgi:hypothetical protein